MTDQISSRLHTAEGVSPTLVGSSEEGLTPSIRPIKYRYVLADIRTGKIITMLPLTQVTYNVGIYAGQEMSGTVYLPDMYLDLMSHPPSYDYLRMRHPEQGTALGSMFECGNRAIYIMRNDEVVWGGILWSRSYSSGDSTMSITGLSWDGYIYYRALRRTVAFLAETDRYTIWRTLLAQVLAMNLPAGQEGVVAPTASTARSDFDWKGTPSGSVTAEGGVAKQWTGITKNGVSSVPLTDLVERWPYNSPPIELPMAGLTTTGTGVLPEPLTKGTIDQDWRGYEMKNVGEELQTWAENPTLVSTNNFEYRVLCWWDETRQRFRQRYTFGEMIYSTPGDYGTATGIKSLLVGTNSYATAITVDNPLIFDYPGHISEWSLQESMEDAATRVIVTGNPGSDGASKIAAYEVTKDLLYPTTTYKGADGWLLYDKVFSYESSSPTAITNRARVLRNRHWPPQAATIADADVGIDSGITDPRTSMKATQLSVTLYVDPTATFPKWGIGDWAAFAIADPFYGGKMYFVRRIISYTVTVVPDHESDYSHEQISLELTDMSKQDPGS